MRLRGERSRGGGGRRLAAIALAAAATACGPKLPVTTRPDADAARALFVGPPDSWIRISVATGDGRIVEEIFGEPRVVEGYGPYVEGRISDPVLSPDGGRIAMVRWVERGDWERHGSHGIRSGERRLVVRDRSTGEERTLAGPSDDLIRSPTWSRDGSRLAAILGQAVVVFDAGSAAVLSRSNDDRIPDALDPFLVWDWATDRIALHANCLRSPCHAWIDPRSGASERVAAKSLDVWFGSHDESMTEDVARGLDRAELERMFALFFGSVENPVGPGKLAWSTDRRYYVYLNSEETTFHWREWYEGYDTRTGTKFLVKDCGKHFQIPVP